MSPKIILPSLPTQKIKVLNTSFYNHPEVTYLARQLLGKFLFSKIESLLTVGMIVETEAYCGATDKACHAYGNRRTDRTEVMFGPGGYSYVYLCYGIHHLLNVVTNVKDKADAVLIRAIAPVEGIETMLARRHKNKLDYPLTAGPGALAQALGINKQHYGLDLTTSNILWIEDRGIEIPDSQIIASPRVGVAYAQEDALLPWRYRIKDSPWVSKAK